MSKTVKVKGKGTKICIAPHRENLTPEALRYGSAFSLQIHHIPAFSDSGIGISTALSHRLHNAGGQTVRLKDPFNTERKKLQHQQNGTYCSLFEVTTLLLKKILQL